MTSWKKRLWMLPGLVGLWLWYAWPLAPQGNAERWVRIEPQLLQNHLGLAGKLHAARQITVAAPFDGVIAAVAVTHGQRVQAGQPLFTLDTAQLDMQLRQAEADWLKARSSAESLQAWHVGPDVSRARRTLANARASLAASQVTLDDTQRLFERGIVARMEVEHLALQVGTQRQAVLDAEQELHQTQARGQGDALRIAQMELANAEARRQALLTLREQRVVKASFSAVAVRATEASATAAPQLQKGLQVVRGMPLLELIELDRLQVLAAVEEQDLATLREGQEVQVSVAGQQFAGRVAHIAQQPRADGAQGAWYDVVADIDLPPAPARSGLRLGMSAQLTVLVYRNERGLVVPAEALQEDEAGRAYVDFREQAGQLHRSVPVTVSGALPQGVEVQGLEPGYIRIPVDGG